MRDYSERSPFSFLFSGKKSIPNRPEISIETDQRPTIYRLDQSSAPPPLDNRDPDSRNFVHPMTGGKKWRRPGEQASFFNIINPVQQLIGS